MSTTKPIYQSPFLKYPGGKRRLLPQILPHVPAEFGAYYEPFLGGGALFFALQGLDRIKNGAVLSDINEVLFWTYRGVQESPEKVNELLQTAEDSSDYYYACRDSLNKIIISGVMGDNVELVAASVIYLNKTGFNGLFRFNRKGEYNTPRGKYVNPKFRMPEQITASSIALLDTKLINASYDIALDGDNTPPSGSFVYLDPPYVPLSKTSNFTAYSSSSFGLQEHADLRKFVDLLTVNKIKVMVSNSDTPETRELYKDYRIETLVARRSIGADGETRKVVSELLILNY